MNKDEIVETVAEAAQINKAQAERALDAVVDTITFQVAAGRKILIPGLGTFDRRIRAAREGRNPQTGEPMQIEASTTPGFKAAAGFKRAVAGD